MGLSGAWSWSTQAADFIEHLLCAKLQSGMRQVWGKRCPGGVAVLLEGGTEGCLEEEAFELS